ncbi:hypothetical protein L1987_80607 [Smallanthus sonchifolius]|uniref:Uncharacterized protein n=1 Tax=Smallanthus sonchifolius TaxID=185202 RepID=A0ACB8YMH9_9ASTR|nr:hypothetical protein L1987_80607 [Smallanthus sonchifolius]
MVARRRDDGGSVVLEMAEVAGGGRSQNEKGWFPSCEEVLIMVTMVGKGRGGNNNNTGGANGNANTTLVTRTENHEGCNYKTFEWCKPKSFDGKKGAIDTTQWITKMDAVIKLSECRSEQAVKFAANSLETTTLDWSESVKQARGEQTVDNM